MQPPGEGCGDDGGEGEGGGNPASGGYQPLFTQVPPPKAVKGSGVTQLPDGAGCGTAGVVIVGGNQPPLMHLPPPSAPNGSAVPQPDVAVLTKSPPSLFRFTISHSESD